MGYLAVWTILEKALADFRKKRVDIPSNVMEDLRSARTIIEATKTETFRTEDIQRIEEYLTNVEMYIYSEGEQLFGAEYVNEKLRSLEAARKAGEPEEKPRFVSSFPRGRKWIRVKPSKELSVEKLESLAERLNLSHSFQDDGFLLVSGGEEKLGIFVKEITEKHGGKDEANRVFHGE